MVKNDHRDENGEVEKVCAILITQADKLTCKTHSTGSHVLIELVLIVA